MEKVKNGIIFALALTVAYGCGFATATAAVYKGFKDATKERTERRVYRSYRDY